jgi:hypothetical protein
MKRLGFALLPLSLFMACSTQTPIGPSPSEWTQGAVTTTGSRLSGRDSSTTMVSSSGAVVRSVTGTALRSLSQLDPDAHGWRVFTITALEHEDGSVSGQFEMHLRQFPVRIHGRITCMGLQGNAAWLGGVIELIDGSFPGPPGLLIGPGTPMRIRVVDNGEGSDAPTDLISGLGTFGGQSEGVELGYCATKPNQPMLNPVEAGNIQVRG